MKKRKLASLQKIWKIDPIENADRLELAHVEGWQVVTQKGEYKPGDVAVYFEIDSFLPMESRYSFLRNSSYKKSDLIGEGYRIKTAKLRGQLSQGLLMPLSDFPEITTNEVGTDVTDLLHVKKWEIEERATAQGTIIGTLTAEVPKTEELRTQNVGEDLIPEFDKQPYYITTKMDGSSHSIEIDKDDIFHCFGHNYEYDQNDGKCDFVKLVKKMGFEEKLRNIKRILNLQTIVAQGELCGPGIQKNPVKLDRPHWYVFTVILDGKRKGIDVTESVVKHLGAEMVPVEEINDHFASHYPTIDAVLQRADQSEYTNGLQKAKAEGIVIRPVEPVWSDTIGDWLSMKAVSNKYLLKKRE